jgi:CubicO group peptidase (beta-lactamase class C family)
VTHEPRVATGYEPVAAVFAEVLAEAPHAGAAFAAFLDDEPVVDLWGGWADEEKGEPWCDDTIQLVFSGTKGLVATCLLLLVDRGVLELEAPVSLYWPEFAAAGKGSVTVGEAVSHLAAVPGLRGGFSTRDLLEPVGLIDRVAAEDPFWEPGTKLAYHAITFGCICDGLVRRTDGRSAGRFFAEEIAAPLGLDAWIGLPEELEPRVARLVPAPDYGIASSGDERGPLLEALYGELSAGRFPWNDPELHRAEIPGAGAIGAVRSIARLYGCLARGGELDGFRLLGEPTIALGRRERSRGVCAVTLRPYAFATGFELQTELGRFGPIEEAFGHTGSGGSVHGAWPSQRVGFSYASSDLQPEARDGRGPRLLTALAFAVGAS